MLEIASVGVTNQLKNVLILQVGWLIPERARTIRDGLMRSTYIQCTFLGRACFHVQPTNLLTRVLLYFSQMALEELGWNHEETRFPLEGRVLFTQPSDANWKIMVRTAVKMNPIQAVLCVLCPEELPEVTTNKELIFPPDTSTIKDASLIMVREKSGKYTLVRVSTVRNKKDWSVTFLKSHF